MRIGAILLLLGMAWSAMGGEGERLFVAPVAQGTGEGSTREAAADFRNPQFWRGLNARLARGPVTVTFLSGRYVVSENPARNLPTLHLEGLGHERHALILEGERAGAVVFTRHEGDRKVTDYPAAQRAGLKGPGLFFLAKSRHTTVRHFTFTAPHVPMGYATNFAGGRDLTIENCHWHDLQGVYFGATGTTGAATDHVTFKDCRFERVGSGGHAHMIYNAYDPLHIRLVGCHFEDCAGDYVRFRDGTDYAVVFNCTFRSTGTYLGRHQPFVAMPLFNDDNPAAPKRQPNYEYFGTHFLIGRNRFIYETEEKPETRIAVLFHHSGFNPPNRQHLLDRAESALLKNGTAAERRALLRKNLGIDVAHVHVFDNEYTHVAHRGVYRVGVAYGAKSRGGEAFFAIGDLFNPEPVAATVEQALEFFGRRQERPQ